MSIHRFLLISLLAFGAFVFVPNVASAATEAYEISTDTRWTVEGSPYIVRQFTIYSGLGIKSGATLTIDPGVVVKFEPRAQLISFGRLVAHGSADQPIVFTSLLDDSAGGDTNRDDNATSPQLGDWYRLTGGEPVYDFDHVQVRYSTFGLDLSFTSVPITITNSLFEYNGNGIRLTFDNSNIVIENNTFRHNSSALYFLALSNRTNFARNNNIADNQIFGAENAASPDQIVDMRGNFWGHASGPFNLANNPLGQGDAVSDRIIFEPWLEQEVIIDVPERNPVIIVPGIPGTELFHEGEKVWIDVIRTALSLSDDFLDVLLMDEEGGTLNNILPGDIIRKIEAIFTFDYSHGLITELQSQGYAEGTDLFTFPYDWRKDIMDISSDFNSFLESNFDPGQKVDIIAHSMGGLMAKEYIKNFGTSHIDKLIFVGSPHLGSPKSAKVLIFGDPMAAIPLLNYKEIKKIARNMPSLNQLLPDRKYFETIGRYLKIDGQPLDYETTKQTLIDDLGLNDYLINQAEAFHSSGIDDLDLSQVNAFNINGCTTATMGSFQVDPDLVRLPANIKMVPGDGTVPLGSSKSADVLAQNTYFVKKAEHSTMMSFEPIRKLVSAILADSSFSDSKITQDISQCKIKGKLLGIFSPIDVKVTDQDGNYSGPNEFASFTNNIPGVAYEVFGDEKFVFLPTDEGQSYQIELDATDTGTFDLKIQDIDGDVQSTAYYNEVGITPESAANFDISATSGDTNILFDYEGDGSFNPLPADSVLDSEESTDETAPQTSLNISGLLGDNDWYRSNVEISLDATDDNSGLLKTEYSLDEGQTWQTYLTSFTIASQGISTIQFFSTDRAGNREEIKSQVIKIDVSAPEAIVSFDQINQDVIFSGTDNLSSVLVQNLGNVVIFTDEAGNNMELALKKSRDKRGVAVEISEIKYNGISRRVLQNRLLYSWSLDKAGHLSQLLQSAAVKDTFTLMLYYMAKTNQTAIRGSVLGNTIDETKFGLVILKIKTNNGVIGYEY